MIAKNTRYMLLTMLIAATACGDEITGPESAGPAYAMAAAAAGSSESSVYEFGKPPRMVEGNGRVVVNERGISYSLRTSELTPGNAYTLWVVIFNNPAGCSDACGEDDLFEAAPMVDIVYGGGNVVGRSGKAGFAGRRMEGDNSGSVFGALGAPALGLIDTRTAEIHLVVRDHGPKIPGMVAEQTQTFGGACTPASSFGLGDGTFECADVQFAVHLAQQQ